MPSADPSPPRILLRPACSAAIGFGHLRRCLTLAEAIVERGGAASLLVAGTIPAGMQPTSIALATTTADAAAVSAHAQAWRADLVLVDDYAWSAEQFAALTGSALRGAIDDLADRPLALDVILNPGAGAERLHYGVAHGQLLLGPSYALLRAPYRNRARKLAAPAVRRVLITLGGSDPLGLTGEAVRVVRTALPDVELDVVIGPLARASVSEAAGVTLHVSPPELADLMELADLAVSAGGQTLYEVAALGVPTIAIEVAANQRLNLEALAAAGTLLVTSASLEQLGHDVAALARDTAQRQRLADAGRALIDGEGAIRAADALLSLVRLRSGRPHG